MNDTTHILLNDGYVGCAGYFVSITFYNAIRLQVEEVIPLLDRDEKYTLQMLCGEAFWDPLTEGERRMAGRCMSHMVRNNLLPLRFAESKHEYPKFYELL
jgi:hypothetical protein